MALKTNYKDDILDLTQNDKRCFEEIQNQDGSKSFRDVTVYEQEGDNFGASDMNATNLVVNQLDDNLTASDNLKFQFTKSGNDYGYKDSNGNFHPFNRVQASKTVTAGTSAKTVSPDSGYHGIASVTVNPTPSQSKSITATTSAQTISPDSGKLLSSVTVNPTPSQTKTVTATTSAQTVNPDSGKLLSSVTVNPQVHSGTRASVTSNGTVDLGANHATRYVPVNIPTYKVIRYVAVTKGNNAGGTVQVTRYDPDGTSETRTTYCNSNESAGWPELSVFAWEHWQYQFNSVGSVYLDGSFRQGGSGNFASYDSGDGATRTHTVEVLVKA